MKRDWNGNGNSVPSRLAINKDYTTKNRQKDDFYATDPTALEMLLDNCSLFLRGVLNSCMFDSGNCNRLYSTYLHGEKILTAPSIWECACGNGNLYHVLKERGYNCIYSDVKDRSTNDYPLHFKGMLKIDFLKTFDFVLPTKYNVAVILTNPPYSLATEFIEHALDILPDGGLYIALMNITYLAGQKRYNRVYQFGTLREVYIFSKRIECWKNNNKEQWGGKAMADYGWYVFQKGYCGQPTLYWL